MDQLIVDYLETMRKGNFTTTGEKALAESVLFLLNKIKNPTAKPILVLSFNRFESLVDSKNSKSQRDWIEKLEKDYFPIFIYNSLQEVDFEIKVINAIDMTNEQIQTFVDENKEVLLSLNAK